jgi:tetratricopeptide (TPR) repeat protein
MRVIAILFLTGLLVSFAPATTLAAGQARIALVIGNSNYPNEGYVMNDVTNDTRDMADELRRDGFEVDIQTNLTTEGMRQALARFYDKIQPGVVALLFFDGFGIQIVSQRQTYLLGVDAPLFEEREIARDGFNLEKIIQEMDHRGAEIKIAIVDAARSNAFERVIHHYSAGLAPVITPNNSLVIYSTAAGSVISNVRTDHGLFVTELLREIRVPGTSADTAFLNTQKGVSQATNKAQVPWLSSSMTSDFCFFCVTPHIIIDDHPACVPTPPTPAPTPEAIASDTQIQAYTKRIQQDPGDRIAYYKRGQLYAIKGAYPQAVTDFDQAIHLNVKDAEAYNNRCWARAATGELLDALRDCDQALSIKPELYDALDSRGLANLKLGRYPQAINDYNASLDKNPQSSSSLFGRGLAAKFSGGDGTADITQAKSMDHNIAAEFASYGVNECHP